MPTLIIEFSGKRRRVLLAGRAVIGRTPNNDVVIDHFAVSRTHAVIEAADGHYCIFDPGSKNGTMVGESTLRKRRRLADGDRISIGPAVLTFYVGDSAMGESTESSLSATHAGILMDCICGAKLWVPGELIGGRGNCQKCGRSVVLQAAAAGAVMDPAVVNPPAVRPAAVRPTDLDPTVVPPSFPARSVTPDAPNARASLPPGDRQVSGPAAAPPAVVGTCSICQWRIEPVDQSHVCPACGQMMHLECWTENRGCSAYGCSQVGILDRAGHPSAEQLVHPADGSLGDNPTVDAEDIGHPPDLSNQPHPFPWEFALLAGSVVGSILGLLLYGLLPIVTLAATASYFVKHRRHARTPALWGAMAISLAGIIAGLAVSSFWWLNSAPLRR